MEFYLRLPEKDWQPEDCLSLAKALLAADRLELARAALEAARMIDPKDPATSAVLDAFTRKQTASAGRERTKLQEALGRVEPLRFIPRPLTRYLRARARPIRPHLG